MRTAAPRPCLGSPTCPSMAGQCAIHARLARQQDQQRPNADVRRWYHTAAWRTLRALVLRQQPLCVECEKAGAVTAATECDHIEPHGGDPAKFWNRANLQGLCASCHARKTRAGL